MKFLYCAVLAVLLASCAFSLGGCVSITLYPEYMTGSCIGMACQCANNEPRPASPETPARRQIEGVTRP